MNEDNSVQLSQSNSSNIKKTSNRDKYGQMLVCQLRGKPFITLGPNYLCWGITFTSFVIFGILLINYVYISTNNFYYRIITLTIVISQNLSYLLVATKNPGIIINQGNIVECAQDEEQQGIHRFCKRCGIQMIRFSYHCRECDVCIQGYDHHCPWTSKCIGKGNLIFFYIFLVLTPLFLLYSMIAFAMCLTSNALQANSHLPQNI